jgi:hypothetical protein
LPKTIAKPSNIINMKTKLIIAITAISILAAACSKETRTTTQVNLSTAEVQKIVQYNPMTKHYELDISKLPKTKVASLDIEEIQFEIDKGNRLLDSILTVNKADPKLKKIELSSSQSHTKTVFSKSISGGWNESIVAVEDSTNVDPSDSTGTIDFIFNIPRGRLGSGDWVSVIPPFFVTYFHCNFRAVAPFAVHTVTTRFWETAMIGTAIGTICSTDVAIAVSGTYGTIGYYGTDSRICWCDYVGQPEEPERI